MSLFHGWKMVAAGAGLQFLQGGLLHQAFGAYFSLLAVEKGWSKTSLAAAAALQSTEAALVGPLLGWIIDRSGAQAMLKIGICLMAAGFLVLSVIQTLPGFYGAILLIALGASMCGYFPLTAAVIQWFERRRARALSVLGLGLALGGLMTPLVAASMSLWGWRHTAQLSALLLLVAGLPLAFVFRRRPEDLGQFVDGIVPAPESIRPGAAVLPPPERDLTAGEALRTGAFWLICSGHAIALLVVTAVNVHAIHHIRESLGFGVAQAAAYMTLMTMAQVVGVLAGGVLGDRYDKCRIAAGCMLAHALGLALLAVASGAAMLVGFALLHGLAWGVRGPLMQAIRADFFGRSAIGKILGLSALFTAVGQIAGPLVAGMLADASGDYRLGLSVLAVTAAAGSFLFLKARAPRRPLLT